jgi:hypothetical protein
MRSTRFGRLRERLLVRGVAPGHVRRIASELEQHFDDLVAGLCASGMTREAAEFEAERRLGEEDVLVASILARPELQSWVRRRAPLAFTLLPILGLALAFVLSILALAGILHIARQWFGVTLVSSHALRNIGGAVRWLALWGLPFLTALSFGLLAARRRVPLLWPLIGMTLVALIGAVTNLSVEWLPEVHKWSLSAGIGFQTGHWHPPAIRAGVTIGLAILPLLWGLAARKWWRVERLEAG